MSTTIVDVTDFGAVGADHEVDRGTARLSAR